MKQRRSLPPRVCTVTFPYIAIEKSPLRVLNAFLEENRSIIYLPTNYKRILQERKSKIANITQKVIELRQRNTNRIAISNKLIYKDSLRNLIQLNDFKKSLIKHKSVDSLIPINALVNKLEKKIRIIKLDSNEKFLGPSSQHNFITTKRISKYNTANDKTRKYLSPNYYSINSTPDFFNDRSSRIPRYYSRSHFITNN